MSEIIEIRCPSCGSNESTKIGIGKYKCRYCDNIFEIKDDILEEEINQQAEYQKLNLKNKKTDLVIKKIVFALFGIFFTAFLGVFIYLWFSDPKSAWKDKNLVVYKCFIGSNGPIIFKLLEQKSNEGDSVRYFTKTIDPLTGQLQQENNFGTTMNQGNSPAFLNSLNPFYVVNDVAYTYSKDSGLVGYSIYMFEQRLTSFDLKKRFPELKQGITNAVFFPDSKAFTLTASDGKDYFYYPEDDKLTKSVADTAESDSVSVNNDLYLTSGKAPRLVSMEYDPVSIEDEFRISEDRANDYTKKNRKKYEKDYGIYGLKKIESKAFYLAKVLGRYKNGLLILFAEDASATSKIVLELVDENGKTIWQNKDNLLQTLRNQATAEELFCDFSMLNDNLAITSATPSHATIGIYLGDGTTQWTFPSKTTTN